VNSDWLLSAGAGYRQLLNAQNIWGSYVFIDRQATTSKRDFWLVSPGLEWINTTWDGRVNAYLPIGAHSKVVSLSDGVGFTGHSILNLHYQHSDEIGPGADVDVAHRFTHVGNLKFHLGAYYFDPKHTPNTVGITTGLEYPLTRLASLQVDNSYDNRQHNTVMVGLKLSLGSAAPTSNDIHQHLYDTVDRHVGIIATGTGVPDSLVTKQIGQSVTNSHVWFFKAPSGAKLSSSSVGSCTYEHPCTTLTQTTLNTINSSDPNATLYLASGTYNLAAPLTLHAGQSLDGRSMNYTTAGTNTILQYQGATPTITGAINLSGNNTLDSITLLGNGKGSYGIAAMNVNNATLRINNVTIGNNTTHDFPIDLYDSGNNTLRMTGSTLYAYGDVGPDSTQDILGIEATNQTIYLNNNKINATASGNLPVADAIRYAGNGTLFSTQNEFNVAVKATTTTVSHLDFSEANGISITDGTGKISSSGDSVNVTVTAAGADTNAVGIIMSAGGSFSGSHDTFTVTTSSTNGTAESFGMWDEYGNNSEKVSSAESTFTLSATSTKGTALISGLNNTGLGTMSSDHDTMVATGTNDSAATNVYDFTGVDAGQGTVSVSNDDITLHATANSPITAPIHQVFAGLFNEGGTIHSNHNHFHLSLTTTNASNLLVASGITNQAGKMDSTSDTFQINSVSSGAIAFTSGIYATGGEATPTNDSFTLTTSSANNGAFTAGAFVAGGTPVGYSR